ncbi:MAG: hypothetical protein COV29_02930 [Candidatus Yanofskybacteria bacterium CG10_big_fil_rev_8_21_14_0_10_36_16]|uniref:Uncharacterized protein n=1 Tax=Candidatus Yanofskybacteria bacterium CG10_big_fil_rev_8_21_14_0_10_36_16 TaxID=1975096 RepID=A0A2J0Q6T7_9BACT|nr:MAG: hypothetical protein COV29_02930 [Candidatus Yanofskybacteria bacterium CG10_big_fil_rev_8_21_14_0_10_36_16]
MPEQKELFDFKLEEPKKEVKKPKLKTTREKKLGIKIGGWEQHGWADYDSHYRKRIRSTKKEHRCEGCGNMMPPGSHIMSLAEKIRDKKTKKMRPDFDNIEYFHLPGTCSKSNYDDEDIKI